MTKTTLAELGSNYLNGNDPPCFGKEKDLDECHDCQKTLICGKVLRGEIGSNP